MNPSRKTTLIKLTTYFIMFVLLNSLLVLQFPNGASSYPSQPGNNNSLYTLPQHICTDGTYVYITDTENDRVVKRLALNNTYVDEFGTSGAGDNNLNNPTGIYYYNGELYIADSLNDRIMKVNASTMTYVDKLYETKATDFVIHEGMMYISRNGGSSPMVYRYNTTDFDVIRGGGASVISSGVYSGVATSIDIDSANDTIFVLQGYYTNKFYANNLTYIDSSYDAITTNGITINNEYLYQMCSVNNPDDYTTDGFIKVRYKSNLTLVETHEMFNGWNLINPYDIVFTPNNKTFVVDNMVHAIIFSFEPEPFEPATWIVDFETANLYINGEYTLDFILNKYPFASWNLVSAPDWLSINYFHGTVSGIAEEVGTFNVSVFSQRNEEYYWYNTTLTVHPLDYHWVDSSPDENIEAPSSYAYQFSTTHDANVQYYIDTDANGLDINETGYMSWAQSSEGAYDVNITATFVGTLDGYSHIVSVYHNYTLTVTAKLAWTHRSPATSCYNNTTYAYDFNVNKPNAVFSLDGNATWLSMNETTGVLSGTPTELGIYNVNISVAHGLDILYHNYTITVTERPPRFSLGEQISGYIYILLFIIVALIFLAILWFIDDRRSRW